MKRLEVEGILTGSRPMPAYGGVRLADELLEDIVSKLRSGRVPMLSNHNIRKRMSAEILEAEVRHTDDGFKEVWIRFLVDEAQWREFEADVRTAGAPGGFSFSAHEPLTELTGFAPDGGVVDLAADASYWSDEVLLAAAEELRPLARTVAVARRYEFSHQPAAVVVLEFAATVGLGVLSNAAYDALKRFLSSEEPTIFHFRIRRGDETIEARLETTDPDVLNRALDSFDQLSDPLGVVVWDEDTERWGPPLN